jgi:nicotinamidase-related amidase
MVVRNADPAARVHYGALPPFDIAPGKTALVVVDVQYYDAHREYGLGREAARRGTAADLAYLFDGVDGIIPNIQRVQAACRQAGIEVMHVRIASLTRDGRDAPRNRPDNVRPPYIEEKDAQILDEVAPVGDELVFSKTTGSAFTSTTIDWVLRNMGIQSLLMCGVVTSGCVTRTARDADDRGYQVMVIGDCCAASTATLHENALQAMNQRRMQVKNTDEIVALIEAACPSAFEHAAAAV